MADAKDVSAACGAGAPGADDAAISSCGFIFDCDGTLMDTIDAWHEAENKLMAEAGISLTKEERDELNSLTLDEAGNWFYEKFDVLESPEQVRQLIFDHMLDYYRTQAELNPGVQQFVDELEAAQVPMAILSSSPQDFLQAGLDRVGMTHTFDAVVSVDDLGTTKRDVATYHALCEQLGSDPALTWFFDDSWYALKTAQEAGLRVVGVFSKNECGTHNELARYSEHVIDDFTGLTLAGLVGEKVAGSGAAVEATA